MVVGIWDEEEEEEGFIDLHYGLDVAKSSLWLILS